MDNQNKLNSEHILIDDQEAFHEQFFFAAQMLRISSYQMHTNSDEILDFLPPVDCEKVKWFFIDWNLIGSKVQKGELIKEVRERLDEAGCTETKIYVLSTSDSKEELAEAKEAGANGWIYKADLDIVLETWREERNEIKEFKLWKA